MARLIGYVRVSTQEQEVHGTSIESQIARIEQFCSSMGHELVDIVKDEGVSGTLDIGKRQGGAELLGRLANGEADSVIAISLSRLFRSTANTLATVDTWTRADIGMVILDLNGMLIDTNTSTGKFMLTLLSALNEMEAQQVSERTTAIMQHKRQNKQVYCKAVMGWDIEDNKLIRNEGEQRAIKAMVQARSAGYSYQQIADALKRSGILTKTGKEIWQRKVVSSVIANEDMHDFEDLQPIELEFIITRGGKEYVSAV